MGRISDIKDYSVPFNLVSCLWILTGDIKESQKAALVVGTDDEALGSMESKSFKIEHNVYRDTFSKASYPGLCYSMFIIQMYFTLVVLHAWALEALNWFNRNLHYLKYSCWGMY